MRFVIESDGIDVKVTGTADCDRKMMLNTALTVIDEVIKDIREVGDDTQAEKVKNLVTKAVLEME